MNYLNCYSIIGMDILSGISVNAFDSIIPNDINTTAIQKAIIQMIPVVTDPVFATRDFKKYSQMCVSFIKEAPEHSVSSNTGVILCIDPKEWHLCTDKASVSLIDPCGKSGHILLYIGKHKFHTLVYTKDPSITVNVNEDCSVHISKENRAALLLDALYQEDTIEAAPEQSLKCCSTDKKASVGTRHCTLLATSKKAQHI